MLTAACSRLPAPDLPSAQFHEISQAVWRLHGQRGSAWRTLSLIMCLCACAYGRVVRQLDCFPPNKPTRGGVIQPNLRNQPRKRPKERRPRWLTNVGWPVVGSWLQWTRPLAIFSQPLLQEASGCSSVAWLAMCCRGRSMRMVTLMFMIDCEVNGEARQLLCILVSGSASRAISSQSADHDGH